MIRPHSSSRACAHSRVFRLIAAICLFSQAFSCLALIPRNANASSPYRARNGDLSPVSFVYGLIAEGKGGDLGANGGLIRKQDDELGFSVPNRRTSLASVAARISESLETISLWIFGHTTVAPFSTPNGTVAFDFDSDGKGDLAVWNPATNSYKIRSSSSGSVSILPIAATGQPSPADFDNDGKTDPAIFSAGTWTIKQSSNGTTLTVSGFGQGGDFAVPGDWTGDGISDLGVYRNSNGTWYVRNGVSPNTITSVQFGASGDIPIAGNFDGDSQMDQAVFRPSNGYWYINGSSSGFITFPWGLSGDIPFGMDFDNDGKSDPGVYRPSTGTWYVLKSSTAYSTYFSQAWGSYGDQPTPADLNGDGKVDFSVWRPTTGVWHTLLNGPGTYEHETLGIPGDLAVSSAYIKQVGAPIGGSLLAGPRLDPENATGGTNLYSRNFAWGTSLAVLPGRSGLNASLNIGYNSLVWLKSGSTMVFDPDASNAGPGFRIGLPTIEPAYYDSAKSVWAYLMVTASGARFEFRQSGVGNTYFTSDSGYSRLTTKGADNPNDPVEDIEIVVTTTDGTSMHYIWLAGAYRCDRITDRNGNYIVVTNSDEGLLTKITDTLGREINIVYDEEFYPVGVTQTWKGGNGAGTSTTHTYATFSYTTETVDTNWDSNLLIYGPPDGAVVKVLDKITYSDGSATAFDYNGYLQIDKVRNIAADSSTHILNYVATDLDSVSGTKTDCPRFGATRSWVENFNNGNEVVVTNSITPNATYSLPGGLTGTATRIDVAMIGHPDGLSTRTYVGGSGWQEGLPLATEDCTGVGCSDRKRWSYTAWTQDDPNVGFPVNPRVTEKRVGDGTNVKRSTVEYYQPTPGSFPFGLPETVKIYDADLSTVLKTQVTTYNLSSAYVDRNIIGLPAESDLFEGTDSGTLMSKVTYAYDYDDDFNVSGMGQNNTGAVNHDDANFGADYSLGRGNLTSVTRWDVDHPTSLGYAVTASTLYNITGSPVAQITPWDGANTRTVRLGYADSWNDGVTRSTYAYPTVLTDPAGSSLGAAGHTSTIKYRFDIGANVEATSPAPAGQTYGKTSTREFDNVGRLLQQSILVNTALQSYVRYEYPANGVQAKSFATIVDTGTNGPDAADEVMSESWTDGAGRTLMTRTEHPGSVGGWSAVISSYDILGRLYSQSVPTEVSVSGTTWTPAGDDATRGWVYNYNLYDWKGRPVRTVPSDSTGTDGKDTLISYDGCGCAGGQVTTVQGPVTTAVDASGNTQTTKRRVQKMYEDILGRTYKTEVWDLDGAGSTPYTTTVNTFNGRDQITETRQYSGGTSSSTYQDTTFSYDGFGRVASSHRPEQRDASDNLRYSTFTYNPDGSVAVRVDPRGASTSITYNVLGLPTAIDYAPPTTQPTYTTIDDTTSVSLSYDNLGNRVSMTDGSGTHSYAYDPLSRLTSETQSFTGLTGNFTTSYGYELTGKLKSITDAFGDAVYYNNDEAGRTGSLTGSSFAGVTSYLSDIEYRAFGGLKDMTYSSSDSSVVSYDYDSALRPVSYEATSSVLSGGFVRKASYEYYNDGSMKKVGNLLRSSMDETYAYDFTARLKTSTSGTAVNGDSETVTPFAQTIGYDAFGNMTSRTTDIWGSDEGGFTATYSNNRKAGGTLDDSGNFVDTTEASNNYSRWKFDASGRNIQTKMAWHLGHVGETQVDRTDTIDLIRDGDGVSVKRVDTKVGHQLYPDTTTTTTKTEYYVISTVLGGKTLTELDENGGKKRTKIYVGSGIVAEQLVHQADDTHSTEWEEVLYKHEDIVTGSYQKTTAAGERAGGMDPPASIEFEPLGGAVPQADPNIEDDGFDLKPLRNFSFAADPERGELGCRWDDAPIPCNLLDVVIHGLSDFRIDVNTRYEGGWDIYNGLSGLVSTWRYDIRQSVNNEDARLTPAQYNTPGVLQDYPNLLPAGQTGLLVGTVYAQYLSPFAEIVVRSSLQKPFQKQEFEALPDRDKLRSLLVQRLDKDGGTCRAFLDSVRANSSIKISETIEELFDKQTSFELSSFLGNGVKGKSSGWSDPIYILGSAAAHDESQRQIVVGRYISVIIHELFHNGGVSRHKAFAMAAYDALSSSEQTENPIPDKKDRLPGESMDDAYSRFFSRLLNQKCPL